MEAFFVSLAAVALAEFGDKTQLLCLCLAIQFRKPLPILAGVAVATWLLDVTAAAAGVWLARLINPAVLSLVLGISLLLMAGALVWPRKEEEEACDTVTGRNAFLASLVAFLFAEMGDKTQIATAMLAAQFSSILLVALGSSLGMLLVNMPVVVLGHKLATKLPMRWIKRAAALLFAMLGVAALLSH